MRRRDLEGGREEREGAVSNLKIREKPRRRSIETESIELIVGAFRPSRFGLRVGGGH